MAVYLLRLSLVVAAALIAVGSMFVTWVMWGPIAVLAAYPSLLSIVKLIEILEVWPRREARPAERETIPIQLGGIIAGTSNLVGRLTPFADTTDASMLTTGRFDGAGSAILGFPSDVMQRLARGDHPTVRRLG